MSESTSSSSRRIEPSTPNSPSRKEGSAGGGRGINGAARGVDDQRTVISNRPPMPTAPNGALPGPGDQVSIGPGTTLAHFQLAEYIGGGGMGRVFRAIDTRLGRSVALKVLSPNQAAVEETLLRFRNEARSAARLNHDGIVQVFYVGEENGVSFIALEFVQGTNVRDMVDQHGPLSLPEAIHITHQIAEALSHAAARSVVHRDIKPSNVLVTAEGKVKLIDLGLARMRPLSDSASDLTASGVTLGTFDYISPEQARDPRNADIRSDIYSLGCTLFFMLTGQPPFPEGTVLQKLLQHQGDEPPDIRTFRPELPEEVSRVVKRMMAKSPERRYQDSEELIESIVLMAQQIGLQAIGPGQMRWVVPQQRQIPFFQQHLPWMAPIAALVLIVLVLNFLWSPAPTSQVSGTRDTQAGQESRQSVPFEPGRPYEREPSGVSTSADNGLTAGPGSVVVGARPPEPSPTPEGAPEMAPFDPVLNDPANGQDGRAAFAPSGQTSTVDEGSGPNEPDGGSTAEIAETSPPFPGDSEMPQEPSGKSGASVVGPPRPLDGSIGRGPSSLTSPGTEQDRPRALVVDPSGRLEDSIPTLGAACARAARDDVIELHYTGRLEQDEPACTWTNLQVTIRPGPGYRPVLRYRPMVDPIQFPRSMFSLSGGQVTLEGLAIEVEVPSTVPADDWSVFELGPGEGISLKQCSITVRNLSDHPDVAVFRLRDPPGSGMGFGDPGEASIPAASISLADCIVRGGATLVRLEDLLPVDVDWHNGLLVTTDLLLRADGGDKAPQPDQKIEIDLRHITALVHGGLCLWSDSTFAPHQLPTQISSAQCVFLGNGSTRLGLQNTAASVTEAIGRIAWRGERNCYDGFLYFWEIRSFQSTDRTESWSFVEWLERLGSEAETDWSLTPPAWQRLPGWDRPIHQQTPADYVLLDGQLYGASGEDQAGLQPDRLPDVPPQPASVETP